MDGWLLHVMGFYALGHWFAIPSRLAVVAELERYLYFSLLFLKVNI